MPPVARRPIAKKPVAKPSSSREDDARGLGIVVYGPSGIGKTSWASYFPEPGFIIDSQEEGVLDLIEYKQIKNISRNRIITASNWDELREGVDNAPKMGIKTLIGDSLTGFEKLCFLAHCDKYFDGDWSKEGFFAFQQGPKNSAKTDWPEFLDLLDHVRRTGINVVLIGHSQVKNHSNPSGADFDQYIPYLDKETWAQTHRWAQSVLFMGYDVVVQKTKGALKSKVNLEQSGGRLLYADPCPAWNAKNRYGLESPIDLGESAKEGYDNFAAALKKARSK